MNVQATGIASKHCCRAPTPLSLKPAAEFMIRVQGLYKEFADQRTGVFRALDNVSFEVKPGEIYGLLGPNGAGKTTCLRILSTVLRPTRGVAEVDGINVVQNPEGVRGRIGGVASLAQPGLVVGDLAARAC